MPMIKQGQRRDKGLVLATPRDLSTLTLIAHHGIARHDHIREFLSRYPGGPTKETGLLAETTVKDALDRWRRAGWVEYHRVLANEPGYAYVLKKGLRMVGLDDVYQGQGPAELRYHHYWAVLDVYLRYWSFDGVKDAEFIPERRLRLEATNVSDKKHPDHVFAMVRIEGGSVIPDAVVASYRRGWVDAIEVQLSPLKPSEMQLKLKKLSRATYELAEDGNDYIYNHIHFYVPSEAMRGHIERAREHLDAKAQERIKIVVEPRYERFLPYVKN